MTKRFEDRFAELITDMVAICMEYAANRADKIYIYCSCEEGSLSCDFFYRIKNRILRKHELNMADSADFTYNTSGDRQNAVLDIILEDLEKLYYLCAECNMQMPTEIKAVYDVQKNSLHTDFKYDLVYSQDQEKTAYDIAWEWYEDIKRQNEG